MSNSQILNIIINKINERSNLNHAYLERLKAAEADQVSITELVSN